MTVRIVFLGTPDFAVPTLELLADNYLVAGVITQPDRPAGRGRKLISSPVKKIAQNLDLTFFQPKDINNAESIAVLREWEPDLICVAAFGQILSQNVLNLPQDGCLNVHASLLPRWRGASPINAAILAGDSQSGVTIMKMGPGLDDGPIVAQKSVEIGLEETAGSLSDKLAALGGTLLAQTIQPYLKGEISPQPQDNSLATYANLLTKKDGELDFHQDAESLARKIRAFSPWPGTYTYWKESRLLIHKARPLSVTTPGAGVFTRYKEEPAVGTGSGLLVLDELQLAGKSRLSGKEFLNGIPDWGSN